ncbi:DUF58 domain-containing protein [Paenibacillus apiarius]|uniref:DUF58 domain-containing protein n=1 Tax=Paenibacillus apiarius TaxID=46240 RepID=A0ABT4DWK3_9BACL|nr:DUF58 domain-containing protein [Paenibacillus apiarius]MCY9516896.1 DUF58 domain-containing protein [Paenibacillus apiarius]MCY9521742.1 DUF58 domain-containing protein [Paenibacillus apiarius]MCY9551577.1 DUF58 domain-containing protein [Paenibacillus apiarius]MCY9558732.1 DUF58 domain-containing protein [Paenibacillus apiarius]MCY9683954.1 DUF58 domain-containing protein [Paenibacillus apiarius]
MNNMELIPRQGRSRKRPIVIAVGIYVSCLFYFLFQGGKTSFMLLSMATLLAVYWLSGLAGGIRRVRGERTLGTGMSKFVPARSRINVSVRIAVPGWFPLPYLIVREQLWRFGERYYDEETVVTLDAKRSAVLSYRTPFLQRGWYRYEATSCCSRDLFGVFEHHGKFEAPATFYVMPATVSIPRWNQAERQDGQGHLAQSRQMSRRESTQLNGVREYVHGDRLSRIHWNATAKTGVLKSKQFDRESSSPVLIVMDVRAEVYEEAHTFETAISASASLADYARMNERPAYIAAIGNGLKWWDADTVRTQPLAFKQWLSAVHQERPEQEEGRLYKQLIERGLRLNGAAIAWISGRLTDEDASVASSLSKAGGYGTYVQVQGGGDAPADNARIRMLGKHRFQYIPLGQLQQLPQLLGGEGR